MLSRNGAPCPANAQVMKLHGSALLLSIQLDGCIFEWGCTHLHLELLGNPENTPERRNKRLLVPICFQLINTVLRMIHPMPPSSKRSQHKEYFLVFPRNHGDEAALFCLTVFFSYQDVEIPPHTCFHVPFSNMHQYKAPDFIFQLFSGWTLLISA